MHLRFSKMSIEKLGIYVMDIHHPYLQKTLGTFHLCSKNIIRNQTKEAEPKLLFEILKLTSLIELHFKKDNSTLFPYLRYKMGGLILDKSKEFPISFIEIISEHYDITKLFKIIRKLTNNYKPAPESSPSLKLCYAQLFNFEQDILMHIFLEEDILFPKLLLINKLKQ